MWLLKHMKENKFGNKLKEIRKRKGLSQIQLAEMLGVSYQQIQKYESGKNRISLDRLIDLLQRLDISVAEFFDDNMIRSPQSGYNISLSDKDETFLRKFQTLDEESKDIIIKLIDKLSK